jgi:hypothetical protein
MFKSKGAIVGVAAALAATVLLVAGLAVTSTSGAATDTPFGGAPSGFPDLTGNPPAADENPVTNPGTNPPAGNPAGTAPGIDPNGGAGAGNAAPGSLPNAGFGAEGNGGVAATVILLALAGAALVGAGATAVSTRRS